MSKKDKGKHLTPAGGVRSDIVYFDKDQNVTDAEHAVTCVIHEYDQAGKVIFCTYGICGQRKKSEC